MNAAMLKRILIAVAAVAALPAGAAPTRSSLIDTFDDWSAFAVPEGKGKVCYAGSVPKKQEGFAGKRGDVFIMVTHRPADKVVGEVSIAAGYAYKPNEPVSLEIDTQKFELFSQGDNAWSPEKGDAKIVAAMKKSGGSMVVRGTPAKGPKTVDTYSLKGFTAALNAIGAACGVK